MQISIDKHSADYWRVTFARDGISVTKHLRICDCECACYHEHKYGQALSRGLHRAAREADRDISVMTHGDLMHCEDETRNIAGYRVTNSA